MVHWRIKRARDLKGRYKGDDKSTTFNEAWVVKLSKDRDDPRPSVERVRVAPARDAFLDALNLHTQIKEKLWMERNIYKKE